MKKIFRMIFLIAIAFILFASCSQKEEEETLVSISSEGKYIVYYKNQDGTKLTGKAYQAKAEDTKKIVKELIAQLAKQPKDISLVPVISQKATKVELEISEEILYLNFGPEYSKMSSSEEILCRAALVKTLTQIEGISYLDIKVDNKPLMDKDENAVGLLSSSSFIEGSDDSTKQTMDLKLYFTDKEGNKLIKTDRQVLVDSTVSVERLVLNELIDGPNSEELYPTLPSNLGVLGVSVKDGVCYVNLDEKFVTDALDVAEYIPIYSIVNSLVELSGITKVQISVNGVSDLVFKDSISLKKLFEWNLDYVGGENN